MGDTSLSYQKKIVRIITRMNVGGPAKHVSWVSSSMFEYGWDTVLISGFVESDEDDDVYFDLRNGTSLISGKNGHSKNKNLTLPPFKSKKNLPNRFGEK